MPSPTSPQFETLSQVIRERRTSKNYTGKPVSDDLVSRLLDLAIWAPNHRLTQPWKFRVLTQSGVQRIISHFKMSLKLDELEAFEKALFKLAAVGALIYVTTDQTEDPVVSEENYAASCAAIQNILLAATALEIQSYWSTSKIFSHPCLLKFLEIPSNEKFTGAIWLGYGTAPAAPTRKEAKEKTVWIK